MNKIFYLIAIAIIVISCNSRQEFDEYKTISNAQWNKNDTVFYNFNNSDTISYKNLFINIRNNGNYKYSNLFLITEILAPNQFATIDTLEYEMADATGNFLGKGFSDLKENKLFFKENYVFKKAGNYQIKIIHAMRKVNETEGMDYLEGIESVGLRIEKVIINK